LLPGEVEVKQTKLKGHHGNPITSFEASVEHRKLVRELWQRVIEKLKAGEIKKIVGSLPEKVDKTCHFYLRFDKQLAHVGELVLTDGGDAIHLRMKVAAFPAKPTVAIELVEKFLSTPA
jgi:RNA binding exosome subunit